MMADVAALASQFTEDIETRDATIKALTEQLNASRVFSDEMKHKLEEQDRFIEGEQQLKRNQASKSLAV